MKRQLGALVVVLTLVVISFYLGTQYEANTSAAKNAAELRADKAAARNLLKRLPFPKNSIDPSPLFPRRRHRQG